METSYPSSLRIAEKFIVAFPISHLIGGALSAQTNLITKKSNRLDIVSPGDLRLNLTSFKPDIKDSVSKHQIQSSH